jgi:hypothetical protein
MLALALSAVLAASATVQPAPSPMPPREIIIVGKRIKDAEAALRSCLARNCAPDEDIAATLRLAETHVSGGDYQKARSVLHGSIRRNKREARTYPLPLSRLYRASGRVASHMGFSSEYYDHTFNIYRTLKAGLPEASSRHLFARMEVADMIARTRGHERARIYFRGIAKEAIKEGRPDIAATAELRSLVHHSPPGEARLAGIRRIAYSTDPELRVAALDARLALTRMAYERNDLREAERLRRGFAELRLETPLLIYSPPYGSVDSEISSAGDMSTPPPPQSESAGIGVGIVRDFPRSRFSNIKRLSGNFDDMWVDVGVQIGRNGDVADAKILRSEGDTSWTKPLLASIKMRRYTPVAPTADELSRVERYTYTSYFEAQTGSRLLDRSPQGRIEYLDLEPGALGTQE